MTKRSLCILTLLIAGLMGVANGAPPTAPTGVCIESTEGVECAAAPTPPATSNASGNNVTGLFPGTNLKFYPGFIIATAENESPSSIESKWQALFTSTPNRKVSYRPKGVYGGVLVRLKWNRFYVNENVRPKNPTNPSDPAYDWSKLDAVFAINAVQNEGALVSIEVGDISYNATPKAPMWLANPPYNGLFIAGTDGGSGQQKAIPKYYRFSGPDLRNISTDNNYPIVEEWVNFHRAMHDHLVATGNINKVMGTNAGGETYLGTSFTPPPDWNLTNFMHGIALRSHKIAQIWAESGIITGTGSLTGDQMKVSWSYIQNPLMGMSYPDMKLNSTYNIKVAGRFNNPDDIGQQNTRPLTQATEPNGYSATTYFSPGIPNPWGYSDITVTQTTSHILWALSGPPKGAKKDSGLGQSGDDPSGLMPVHQVVLSWDNWSDLSPTVSDWHTAIDTFGPPGTFAFPYLPPGYVP